MGNLADVCMSTPSQQALHESQTGELRHLGRKGCPRGHENVTYSCIPAFSTPYAQDIGQNLMWNWEDD